MIFLGISVFALLAFLTPVLGRSYKMGASATHVKCSKSASAPISCQQNGTASCCFEGTSGVFIVSQYWDFVNATGPKDQFTMHGLWNNQCSGKFSQFCNPSWQITSVDQVLNKTGRHYLLDRMERFWPNFAGGPNDELWTHEFNKHGTCMDTLSPACYDAEAESDQYVFDFFYSALLLHFTHPSEEWLNMKGYFPSKTETYDAVAFAKVLEWEHEKKVYLGCDENNALQEIRYFYNLRGAVAGAEFIGIDSQYASSCKGQFHWYPKGYNPTPSYSKKNVTIAPRGEAGCLTAEGTLSSSASECSRFEMTKSFYGAHFSSPAGPCGISKTSRFSCGKDMKLSDFIVDNSQKISYDGQTSWHSPHLPSDSNVAVYTGPSSNVSSVTYDLLVRPIN